MSLAVVAERMAGWYEADPSPLGRGWKRCTVHGMTFASHCAGCAHEFNFPAALAAAVKFDSSLGEEQDLVASGGVPVTSSLPKRTAMPTGQSTSSAPVGADSNLPPPTSPAACHLFHGGEDSMCPVCVALDFATTGLRHA